MFARALLSCVLLLFVKDEEHGSAMVQLFAVQPCTCTTLQVWSASFSRVGCRPHFVCLFVLNAVPFGGWWWSNPGKRFSCIIMSVSEARSLHHFSFSLSFVSTLTRVVLLTCCSDFSVPVIGWLRTPSVTCDGLRGYALQYCFRVSRCSICLNCSGQLSLL